MFPLSSLRAKHQADRLLMTFRLFSAWLLSLLTTVFLHENCLGGWKLFWIVCREEAPEHQSFNWKIWDEEILNTKKERSSNLWLRTPYEPFQALNSNTMSNLSRPVGLRPILP